MASLTQSLLFEELTPQHSIISMMPDTKEILHICYPLLISTFNVNNHFWDHYDYICSLVLTSEEPEPACLLSEAV